MDKLPQKTGVIQGLQALHDALQFRQNNNFTPLFKADAHEVVAEVKDRFTDLDDANFGDVGTPDFAEFHDVLETWNHRRPKITMETEESLRAVRDAIMAIKAELPQNWPLYRDLDKIEQALEEDAQSMYNYHKRKF